MCDPADSPGDIEYVDGAPIPIDGVWKDDFTFTLGGKQDGTCIDVISAPGPWHVTITGEGARYLGVIPRDSIGPGDSCGGWLLRSTIYDYGEDNPLILGYFGDDDAQSIPAATINACGTDFAEWIELEYLTGSEQQAHCYEGIKTNDKCLVTEQVDVTHPLVLQVFLRGSANGKTIFEVDLPQIEP